MIGLNKFMMGVGHSLKLSADAAWLEEEAFDHVAFANNLVDDSEFGEVLGTELEGFRCLWGCGPVLPKNGCTTFR